MTPKFLYFDLGNVLLRFSHERMCRQIAEVAGASYETVWQAVFDGGLEAQLESGRIDTAGFYQKLCDAIGRQPTFEAWALAANDIFELNLSILPLVTALRQAGYRLGVLSNTSQMHWEFNADGRYALLPGAFDVVALSYELRAMKPAPEIFQKAAALAGVAPEEIFFTDDVPANVEGARRAGYDAEVYTTTAALAAALRRRGLRFNY